MATLSLSGAVSSTEDTEPVDKDSKPITPIDDKTEQSKSPIAEAKIDETTGDKLKQENFPVESTKELEKASTPEEDQKHVNEFANSALTTLSLIAKVSSNEGKESMSPESKSPIPTDEKVEQSKTPIQDTGIEESVE